MWEMPLWLLIVLIIVLSIVMYFVLRPLKVLSVKEWIISHLFIIIGLILLIAWLWLNKGDYWNMAMLGGAIWTISGGICFAVVYVIRRFK